MSKSSVNIEGLCPICGKNLALVGRAHACSALPHVASPLTGPPASRVIKSLESAVAHAKGEKGRAKSTVVKVKPVATPGLVVGLNKQVKALAPPSHPDCARCRHNREATADRMRKRRAK